MSGSSWKQVLTSCCLYVYGDELKTISAEDLANVDGVSAAISVPDPADSKGGDRFLVLFKNSTEVRRCEERRCIICNETGLKVEHCNNTCDIPDDWEDFMGVPSQTPLQYPSHEAEDQTDTYANVPTRQEQGDVYNMPPMDPQMCRDSGGQQLPVPQGQQNPMIPGQHPFPYNMQMMPPFMFQQEGATAQENLPAGGHFLTPQQQLWMQQMQMLFMQQGRMPDPTAPPPYAASEEKSGSGETPEPEAQPQLRINEPPQLDREAANQNVPDDYDEDPPKEDKEIAMIKVTNIPPDTSEDSLLFFFENRRKSGGGSITELEYDPDTQSAVITFEDPEAVKRVLGKMPILFGGKQIGVEEFRPDIQEESTAEEPVLDAENVLEVRGVSSSTSSDTVEMYFENTRRSGGGDIKKMREEEGTFYIIFEEEGVIESVLRKKHKIDGTAIEVCRYVPPPPPKPVPMYPNKVFIKNLSEKTTKDGLENFLEAKTSLTPTSIEYGELEGTALVTFDEHLDFEKLQLACKKRSLDKSHLEVCKVPVTNCVIVRNVSEKTSRDTLEFYFDNERRSGVTGVLDVKMCDGFCLVYFEEPDAVDVVCAKSHRVDGQILEVKIYYECLGQVESEEDGPFHPPGPLELTDLDTKKMQFLMKSPPNQEAIRKQLEAVYGKPVWPKKSKVNSLSVECTLTAETKDCRKIGRTWEAKVKENMSKFLDLLVVTKHSTLKEAFPLVLNELKSVTIGNPDAVAVVLEKSTHEIYVTGHKQASMEVSKQISDIIQKVDEELDKKKQQIQEEKQLKRHQVLILQFCKFEQNIQKKYKDISLKYDLGKNCVKFEGLSGEVTTAILEMFEFVSKVVKTEVGGISKLLQGFLQNQPVYKYVNGKMREKDVVGVWEFNKEDESLTVFSLSDQQAVQAAHLLKESVIETPINVKEESRPLLKSGEWQSKSSEIEQQAEGLIKIVTHTAQIIILCTDKWEGLSREYIEDFLEANTVYEETLTLEPGMMRYIQMNCAEAIDKVDKDLQQERGAAKIGNTGIMIRGTQVGMNKGKFAIGKIVQSVEKQSHTINKPGIRKHMESQQGRDKLKNVERSQGVVIDVSDESVSDEDNDGSFLKAGAMRRELAVCVTSVGKKISALVVDMMELDIDVIVNPANKDMRHIGGVAKIIVEKGGRSIQEECNDYVRKKGRLMEGQVFLSAAGNLKCKAVVHAVGPVWQNGTNQEEEYLREAVFKSLEVTSEKGFTSVAFPALCTGVFGYPMREATRVVVVAVRDYFKENLGSSVDTVCLCDVKEDTVQGFVSAMKRELQNVTIKSSGSENTSKWQTSKAPELKSFKPSPVAVEAGNITVRVITDQIAQQKVDVIVNTTSKDLKLGNGAVSASLLKAGGRTLQQECDQNYPQGIQHGQIAVTSGGNLSCQFICHGSLPGWDQQGQALKILRTFLKKCLDHVDKNRLSSVAFPAMGTGNLGYPRNTVALEMFDAVNDFGSNNPSTTIRDVRFVLYEKDMETIKAFTTEEKKQGGGGGRHGRQFGTGSHSRPTPTPRGKGGASPGGRNYGGGSSSDLSDSEEFVLDIGNLEFRVYQGDITTAAVDVIVNSTNPEFDLTRGLVSKIILQRGGDTIKKEVHINKGEMKTKGMAVTTAVGLNCQYVLHVDAESQDDSWEDKITKAILRVDEISSCQSVAFPTLGQAFGLAPEKLASHFFQAIISTQEKVRCLKQIHVVIYESKNVNKFLDSFKTCCQNYTPKTKGFFKRFTNWLGYGKGKSDILDNARRNPRIVEDTCSVTLVIYGRTLEQIKKAIQTIDGGIDSLFRSKVFNESIIKQFSSSQENKIKQLKETYDVEVTIEPRIGRIKVHGLMEDVMNAADKVHEVIRKADAARQEKQAAEIMADMVEWCFIDITPKGQELEKYPPEINMKLEKALRNQDSKVSFTDKDGKRYIVDLTNYEEYPEDDKTDVVKVIRKNKIDKSAFEAPVTWSAMDAKDNVAVVTLVPRCEEYKKVSQNFIAGTGSAHSIVKIERIQNRMLLQQYEAKFKLMEKQNPAGTTNERMLWHGTGSDAVASINTYGFNRSYCGKNAVVHGDGVYFAVNANYSARDTYSPRDVNNNKRMYQCRVLTGEFCQSKQGMKVPPNKPGSQHILYDSAVDTPRNPGIFVIFNDTQAYPEYLITFQ